MELLISPRTVVKWLQCSRLTKFSCQLYRTNYRRFHTALSNNVAGIPIKMPSLSPTMSEGTIVKWLKQEGETVEPGDIICDIQTDKAVVSFEVEEEGILAKIMTAENTSEVPVGRLIALMVEPGDDWRAVELPVDAAGPESAGHVVSGASGGAPTPAVSVPSSAGPAVRALLQRYSVDADHITPTGPHGRLLKGDVLAHVAAHSLVPAAQLPHVPVNEDSAGESLSPAAAPAAAAAIAVPVSPAGVPSSAPASQQNFIDLPLSSMRKTIAKRLTQSKMEIPHAYVQCDVTVDRVLAARSQLKADGVMTSVNDFVLRATALSLRLHPQLNCVWRQGQPERSSDVDVSIAVATDAGLITPIVTDAADRPLADVAQSARQLAARARAGALKMHEFVGGTFTISNLGMLGVREFSAIINPPQCAILAVGGGRTEFDAAGRPHTRLTCTLAYDARAISEPRAAAFVETLSTLLASPEVLLCGADRPRLLEADMA